MFDTDATPLDVVPRRADNYLMRDIRVIARIADIKPLVARGRLDPASVLPELLRLAASEHWQTREVAATALVEIGKKHPDVIVANALEWSGSSDSGVRRAASEGLRGIVKTQPDLVWPVLERLRSDANPYVRKSVANVLRNASGRHPDAVLRKCREWSKLRDPNTAWIIKDGLRKLKMTRSQEVSAILG